MHVLIADEMHPSIGPLLESRGLRVQYAPAWKRADLLRELHRYEGLIVRTKTTIDAELLAAGPNLKFIGRAGAGLDQIDLPR
jgi:D-3-phosphoglycerate dehydrogenase